MISSNVLLQGTDVGCMYDVRSQLFWRWPHTLVISNNILLLNQFNYLSGPHMCFSTTPNNITFFWVLCPKLMNASTDWKKKKANI
jgi:hypothetical protein